MNTSVVRWCKGGREGIPERYTHGENSETNFEDVKVSHRLNGDVESDATRRVVARSTLCVATDLLAVNPRHRPQQPAHFVHLQVRRR